MILMIQTIILSYIEKYHTINLEDIREAVNEPVSMIAREIATLYENEFFEKRDGRVYLTEKAKNETVSQWNVWVDDEVSEDDFLIESDLNLIFNEDGYPIIDNTAKLRNAFMLRNMDCKAYHTFEICTKGKIREITAPSKRLKARQKWILRHILEKYKLPDCVHGFVKNKSIVTNATCHLNHAEVGCMDIKDFFSSVSEQMVREVFYKLGYKKSVSEELAMLCTYTGVLPQGAPTSPALANIVLENFDKEMIDYSEQHGITYSRYADDITISGNCDILQHLEETQKKVNKYGFLVNYKKTRIMKEKYRKVVTGLVITDRVRVPKRYKKLFRQEIYYCKKFGVTQHLNNIGRASAVNFKEYMYGKAYYIRMVEMEIGEQFLEQLDEIFCIEN